ncbi:MAG: CBS domain-containing protein [Candidatus Caldarchaeum sp.]|nr:CBS domain-containing protein [Candidatus Caldarchaeum sp.]MCS7138314.1 CBS domain-containing protein [Candidatus Caldarchaeum sp.]MDW7978314.1 CBS domain-containing protein [Candidatus Caldarchaeum sp.]MDW8359964.1 CBS domain-containing protein [Candidatus Caldarchaeum sp.]
MSSIKVSDIMSRRLITAGEGETLAAVAEKMLGSKVSSVVVISNGKVVGIVTEKDFVKFFTLRVPPDDVVKNHMTRSVITVSENTSVNEAKNIMAANKIRHLPVVDEKGRFVGMVTTRDIVEAVETLI